MAPLIAVKPSAPRVEYRVGKHSPGLSAYPLWARWLIRSVYFLTGYQVTSEDIGIAEDEEQADSWCLDSTYFYKPLYVGVPLPEDQCAPGPVVWPRSEAKRLYEKCSPDGVFITRHEYNLLTEAVTEVCKSAHS